MRAWMNVWQNALDDATGLSLELSARTSAVVRYFLPFVNRRHQDEWMNIAPITWTRARPLTFLLETGFSIKILS